MDLDDDKTDDLFDEIIEVDYISQCDDIESSDKENKKHARGPKAKKNQMKKLIAFMTEHKQTNTKESWSFLAQELNNLGPPTFTDSEWKLKWSQHKYNEKRKVATEVAGPSSRQDAPSYSVLSLDPVVALTHETGRSAILNKLDEIIKREDAILERLDETNNLLEKIAQSLAKSI